MHPSRDTSAEVVNAVREAETRARRLKDVIHSAYLLGGTFFVVGALLGLLSLGMRRRADAIGLVIAMSLGSSGLLYMIFAHFLRRRRYWAWVASLVMTIVLLTFVGILTLWILILIVARWEREMTDPQSFLVVVPIIGLGSWVLALALILKYLREALPAVREEEAGVQMGFAVIPVAHVAQSDEPSRDTARERAG